MCRRNENPPTVVTNAFQSNHYTYISCLKAPTFSYVFVSGRPDFFIIISYKMIGDLGEQRPLICNQASVFFPWSCSVVMRVLSLI